MGKASKLSAPFTKLALALDEFGRGASSVFGGAVDSYIDLEAAAGTEDHVLIASDRSCVSLLEWRGTERMVGFDEHVENIKRLNIALQSSFLEPGHFIEVVFGCERYPEASSRMLKRYFDPLRATAKRLQLDLEDVIDDHQQAMARHCAPEYCYIALWTRPSVMTSNEYQTALKRHREETKPLPHSKRAAPIDHAPQALVDTHRSFVDFFCRDLERVKTQAQVLNGTEAIRAIRQLIDPEFTSDEWVPRIPGVPLSPGDNSTGDDQVGAYLWPSLAEQVVPREPEPVGYKATKIGDRLWAPVMVTLPQANSRPFPELFQRLRSVDIPWRIKFTISASGMSDTSFSRSMADLLGLGSSRNRQITAAHKQCREVLDAGTAAIAGLRICAATWVPVGKEDRLGECSSRLARAIQGWGGCEVQEATGNGTLGFFCTVPAVRYSSIAPVSTPPLADALEILPWHRPASPWDLGHFLLRSADGKPFPMSDLSTKQDAWVAGVGGPMGGGKSVLLNCLNLALVLDPANEELPMIRTVDVGPSGSGVPSLVASALPPDQAHKAQYHRIRNTPEYAWNPCDTMLGERFPTSSQRDFLIGFISLLATPLDRDAPQEGIMGIAEAAVDLAYTQLADTPTGRPRKFSRTASQVLTEAVDRHGIVTDEDTSFWELTDMLFERGDLRAAYAAQRLAVPLLVDIGAMAKDESIAKLYPDSATGGVPLVDLFRRKMVEARTQYKVLSCPTQFDFGDAPIITLDLDEVAKRGNPASLRQTAVFYILALQMLTADFFTGKGTLDELRGPEIYRQYHSDRIKKLRRSRRRLCADELHRPAESSPVAMDMIIRVIREGRKWDISQLMASQRIEDFPETIKDLLTALYILKPPASGAKAIAELFDLTETEIYNIDTRLHGPEPGIGGNVYCRWITKKGTFAHTLTSTSGPIQLVAFSSTSEDMDLRDTLYKEFPPALVRKVIAKRFPSGIKKETELRASLRAKSGLSYSTSIMDELMDEARMSCRASLVV